MSEPHEAAPQAVDRKAMLLEQFTAEEGAPKPEVVAEEAPKPDRARDESGKFVAKTDTPKAETAPAPAAAAPANPAPVEEPVWSKPPSSWKKEKHALWEAMTPEQREYAFQREEQMRAGVEPLLPKAELADKISKVAEPYMNTVRGLGLDLPQAVEGLMRVDHQLRTLPPEQKIQLLHQVAASYGINLAGHLDGAQPSFADPNYSALQNELLGIKGQFTSFMQQQEAAQQQAAMAEIQKFAQTADHFEEVKPTMIKLLQSGMAENIPEAYEQAIRLNPEIFEKVQGAKQAAAEAEKRKAADEAAKRAKAAAVSVKTATPGVSKPNGAQDRRSMLREALEGVSDRL